MKQLLLIICAALSAIDAGADYWTQMASFPGPGRGHPFSFSVGNKGYVGSGDISVDDFWEFDLASNTWTQKANYGGGPVNGSVGFSINGKGYAATGNGNAELWEYDTAANAWTQKTNLPAPGRSYAAGFVIGDNVYIGGGLAAMQDFWCWNQPTDTWTQKSNMISGLGFSAGFAINGKGYFCTGYDGTFLNINWEYDTLTDTWTQKANFPSNRMDVCAYSICEKGYVVLGGEAPYYNDNWQYDPVANQWIQKTSFPGTVRDDAAWFVIGNKGYVGLGQYNNSTNYNDFWEYTPDSCSSVPVALFVAPNTICPGTCTDFINQSTGATTYQWFFPGSATPVSTDVNPANICYSTPGNYSVTLIVSNSLYSDTLTLNNYITVYPYPPPQGITQSGDTLFAVPGAVGYQWYYDGNLIPGATDYYYVAQGSGNYNVVATDPNNCEVEAAIFDVIAAVSGEFPGMHGCMLLSPNPAAGLLTIQLPPATNENNTEIYFFDVTGRTFFAGSYPGKQASVQTDTRNFTPGLYYILARSGSQRCTAKIFLN